MFKLRNILLPVIFILSTPSCNKDEEITIPVVDVISPVDNKIFNVTDTVPVLAEINDKRVITHVQVGLVNENFTPVAKVYNSYPDSKSCHLDIQYVLDDNTLESGTYYILVKAENGQKFKNVYRKIRLRGEAVKLEKIIVVTGEGGQHIRINAIDSSQTVSHMLDINCNYAASAISNRFQQLYIAGKSLISLRAYSLLDYSIEWNLQMGILPPIHNDNCLYADEYLFATFNSQHIRGYDENGSVVFTTDITSHDKPGAVFRLNDYVIVDMQKQNSVGTPELVTYYVKSGIKMQSRQTQFEVSEFFRQLDNKVFIIANSNSKGQLFIYNVEFDVLEHLADIQGKIVSSDRIDDNRLLVGAETMIYIYDYSTMYLVPFMEDIAATNITFEPLNSKLYISSLKEINKYTFPEMFLESTFLFENPIKNVHLLYNK